MFTHAVNSHACSLSQLLLFCPALQVGEVHLENVVIQVQHLNALLAAELAGNGKFNPVVLPWQVKNKRRATRNE